MVIRFVNVTTDSRCPTGAQCIWAVEAKCQVQVTLQRATSEVTLMETGLTDGYALQPLNQYQIDFRLQPHPEIGKQLGSSDYKLLMKITK